MINPTTHAITEFVIPTAGSQPTDIVAGPDGNLWFTETLANQIGTINPTTHTITEFATPTSNSAPNTITVGADGNLWFTEGGSSKIAHQPDHARYCRICHADGAAIHWHHGRARWATLVYRKHRQQNRAIDPHRSHQRESSPPRTVTDRDH